MAKINPGEFMRQVQAETRKVVWPSRQETVTTAIFVGIMMVMLAVFFLVLRWGWRVALASEDRFSRLLSGGMVATVFFYIAINLSMVMGLAPVVGIPLPFMSHGGSSMMTNMICLGSLMMVNRWNARSGRRSLG